MSHASKILAGRYEVGDLIGRGGMAEVHIAYDTRLGRTVAVKVLRSDLARDPSFQARFRREAQSAAGLNHPSIVAVYDTGDDTRINAQGAQETTPFIVMEYVEGHTVRDILKGDTAAPIDEAIEIVAGVLTALDYSHHAGLVHRDIKPANVMLTPTGAIKVMDFGIARAMADAGQTMTQTQAVVGTAQYLSPEQARGEEVDARSDLYSTGCLLFELLTGRPPFIGDSPVSVAYQHVREEAPRPSSFASDVSPELDRIVLKSLAKRREERYSSAQEFLSDLQAIADGSIIPAAVADMGSAASGSGAAVVNQAHLQGATQVMPGGFLPVGAAPMGPAPGSAAPGTAMTQVASAPANSHLDELVEDEGATWRQIRNVAILAAIAIGALLLVFSLFKNGAPPVDDEPIGAGQVNVPLLAGMNEAQARTALDEVGLQAVITSEASEEIPADVVIRSEPDHGTAVDEGSVVTIVLSAGRDVVEVPDVRGLTEQAAVDALDRAGLTVSTFEVDNSDAFIAKGRATKTVPESGTEVATGASVVLYVSSGKVELPDLIGMTESEAVTILNELRLAYRVDEVESDTDPENEIIGQVPGMGLIDQGTEVVLQIAVPVKYSTVPTLVGLTEAQATAALNTAVLTPGVTYQSSLTVAAGTVMQASESPGTQLPSGSTVNIVVSSGIPSP